MDKYRKVKIIGEGSFGKALLVTDKGSGQQFVMKEIPLNKMTPKKRADASKEIVVLAQMNHPNIVRFRESFEENDYLFIVMNFCEKGDLYNTIRSQPREFPEDQVMDWFVQISHAIKYIHDRRILHRDIKTKNIFLTSSGAAQLGDFGISKVLGSMEFTRTVTGSPYYWCPEISQGKPYNNKSDIWSLGCVLYELTTLKHPFEANNMHDLAKEIRRCSYQPVSSNYSYDLRGLIFELLKTEPKDRPSVDSILKKSFVQKRITKNLNDENHNKMQTSKPRPSQIPPSRPSANEPISDGLPLSTPPTPAAAHKNINGVPPGRQSDVGSLLDKKHPGIVSGSLLGSNEEMKNV